MKWHDLHISFFFKLKEICFEILNNASLLNAWISPFLIGQQLHLSYTHRGHLTNPTNYWHLIGRLIYLSVSLQMLVGHCLYLFFFHFWIKIYYIKLFFFNLKVKFRLPLMKWQSLKYPQIIVNLPLFLLRR